MPTGVLLYLHLLFAFVFVGALLSTHWNVLAARRTPDPAHRAALLGSNARTTARFGLPSLVLLGLLGNAAAPGLDYRMSTGTWLRLVDGAWIVFVLLAAAFDLPAARRLAAAAQAAAEGAGEATASAYDAALARWRISNALLLAGFLTFLWLMVFRWRT